MDCGDNDFIFKSTKLVDLHFDFHMYLYLLPLELCHMAADWETYALSNINYEVRLHDEDYKTKSLIISWLFWEIIYRKLYC